MTTSATHYFIWYRVTGDAAKARVAVNALLQEIALRTGVTGRLLMQRDDPAIWMEIYENVLDTALFDAVLLEATANAGPGAHAEGERRIERFANAP